MTNIFVFGSNMAGRHGRGAALYARKHCGAVYGQAYGLQGTSFAIPTKDAALRSLPLDAIRRWVDQFLDFAAENAALTFEVTPIGCGLAGYTPEEVAPMFWAVPGNVILPGVFKKALR